MIEGSASRGPVAVYKGITLWHGHVSSDAKWVGVDGSYPWFEADTEEALRKAIDEGTE